VNGVIVAICAVSLAASLILGRTDALSNAVITGAADAVSLVVKLLGGLVFWSGMMRLIRKCGMCDFITKLLSPFLKFLFPKLPINSKAAKYIGLNLSANLLGLGNAATPFGIQAMRELSRLSGNSHLPSDYMVTFAVINCSSIQLLPTTLAFLRAANSSANPMEILPSVLCTSLISVLVGIAFAKIIPLFRRKNI
jgi:spore maturation protein A